MDKEQLIIRNTIKQAIKHDEGLSPYATKNQDCIKIDTDHYEVDDFDLRWPFEEDIDRILYCKSYQRYVDKTQALSFFHSAHITKRSLHVQWVSRIARQIGRSLNLNLDLIEAIALGHDLGHTPYGHLGEKALNEMVEQYHGGYFCHNANSVRMIRFIERFGEGFDVSLQVLDGILCHNGELLTKQYHPDYKKTKEQFLQEYEACWVDKTGSLKIHPMTLEGCVVRVSDIIAYIGKDIEDAIKVGIIKVTDLPKNVVNILGDNNKSIINRLIGDVIVNSYHKDYLSFSREDFDALQDLLQFLRDKVHNHPVILRENEKLSRMISELFIVYKGQLEENDTNSDIYQYVQSMNQQYQQTPIVLQVSDYLSAMTDRYVLQEYTRYFLPTQYEDSL